MTSISTVSAIITAGAASLMLGLAGCATSVSADNESLDIESQLSVCDIKVKATLNGLSRRPGGTDYAMMPRNIEGADTVWHCRKATKDEWCSGFWPGILWYDYEITGDEIVREEAEKYTASLEYLSQTPAFDHDLGFLIFCSYGNGYRLTHNEKFKEVIINTADTLATLFNPKVGTILSWPRNVEMLGGHNTIMDNMINLEMLFWAASHGGDPKLYDIAVKHAETTMQYQFRPDYTNYHVAVYDQATGKFIKGMTHQGYSDNSMWARGQAWAIYGYTMVYRETGDSRFLDFAQKVTDVYLTRLPEDYIPYWDFNDPDIPSCPRDASAAAVVASGLIELSGYVDDDKKDIYLKAARKMLASLGSKEYQTSKESHAILAHSVGHKPAGSEIDASIIYADYYYMEALLRLKKLDHDGQLFAVAKGPSEKI